MQGNFCKSTQNHEKKNFHYFFPTFSCILLPSEKATHTCTHTHTHHIFWGIRWLNRHMRKRDKVVCFFPLDFKPQIWKKDFIINKYVLKKLQSLSVNLYPFSGDRRKVIEKLMKAIAYHSWKCINKSPSLQTFPWTPV